MTVSLLKRRHAKAAPAPSGCRCTVRHPATAEEREQIRDAIVLALLDDDQDRVGYLQLRLGICRTNSQHNQTRSAA
jgi:hypothetical protein